MFSLWSMWSTCCCFSYTAQSLVLKWTTVDIKINTNKQWSSSHSCIECIQLFESQRLWYFVVIVSTLKLCVHVPIATGWGDQLQKKEECMVDNAALRCRHTCHEDIIIEVGIDLTGQSKCGKSWRRGQPNWRSMIGTPLWWSWVTWTQSPGWG